MFSVVIPLYNKEISIANTIQSVLSQTFQDFEIVVVNDGSTDSSAKIVEQINDPRIRLIHQKNQGVSAARNTGIREAKRVWIAFLDGDDLWKKNHLREIIKMMSIFPNERVYTTSFIFSNENNNDDIERSTNHIFKIENYFKEAFEKPIIWTSVAAVHKSCINNVGGFNTNLITGEDLDLWHRLSYNYNIVKSNKVTAIYRIEAENRSKSSLKMQKDISYHYNFNNAKSNDEVRFYRRFIIIKLRALLSNKQFVDFVKLKNKHRKYISLIDVFTKRY